MTFREKARGVYPIMIMINILHVVTENGIYTFFKYLGISQNQGQID